MRILKRARIHIKLCYRRTYDVLEAIWKVLRPIRFNIALLIFFYLSVTIPDQARDLLIGFAQDGGWITWRGGYLLLHLSLVAIFLWLTSETALYAADVNPSVPWQAKLRRLTPIIVGVTPAAVLGIACWRLNAQLSSGEPSPDLERIRSQLSSVTLWTIAVICFAAFNLSILTWASVEALEEAEKSVSVSATKLEQSLVMRFINKLLLWIATILLPPKLKGNPSVLYALGIVLIFFGIAGIVGLSLPKTAVLYGPIAVLLIATGTWSILFWTAAMLLGQVKMPAITILALVFVAVGVSDCNDNHSIKNRVIGSGPQILPSAGQAMQEWLATRPSYVCGKSYPVFIVAAEGGGVRNAYWTGSVLMSLRDQIPDFNEHLFAICGVSGGSVGGTTYAGVLRRGAKDKPLLPVVQSILSEDLLSATIARGAILDVPQQFIPFSIPWVQDRAGALEQSLELAWDKHAIDLFNPFRRGFYQLREGKPLVPHLVLITTEVSSGDRVPISHFIVNSQAPGSMKMMHDVMSTDIKLSTAAFISSRFPLVTPAATVELGVGNKQRYVDGGYYENSATATVQDLIRELLSHPIDQHPLDTKTQVSLDDLQIFVIVIDYEDPFIAKDGGGPNSFGDPLSPLRALLSTRESRARYSRDQLDHFLFETASHSNQVQGMTIRFKAVNGLAQLPLGWSLSKAARSTMDAQLPSLDPVRTPTENDESMRFIYDKLQGW